MKYTLKELRVRKGETQAETAANLGVSLTTYNAWENNVSNLKVSRIAALASYFGVTVGDIFFDKLHENNSSDILPNNGP